MKKPTDSPVVGSITPAGRRPPARKPRLQSRILDTPLVSLECWTTGTSRTVKYRAWERATDRVLLPLDERKLANKAEREAVLAELPADLSDALRQEVADVEVESLSLRPGKKDRGSKQRPASGGRHHFLLMAGLGIDAAVLRRVSTPLKEKIGQAAVALAAAKELPSLHPFPIEIRTSGAGMEEGVLWRGEALQVIVGNTRRYGNIAEVTPEARIDDGVLDVCVIAAGDPLTTIKQILSTLLHREPVHGRSEYFQGAHFWISAPASVDLQLDGSHVKLKDNLAAPDRTAIEQAADPEAVMVTYRFDAMPRSLRMAIPCTYDGALFEEGPDEEKAQATEQELPDQNAVRAQAPASGSAQQDPEHIDALLEHGRKVTVVGVAPNPERNRTYIVAGGTSDKKTGESKPVAVRIDHNTSLVRPTGEPLSLAFAAELPEGSAIVVEGKRSKRGVIRAKRVVVVT